MVGQELWPYIFHILLTAVETNYMQNDRAELSFLKIYIFPGNLLEWVKCVKLFLSNFFWKRPVYY